VAVRLSGPGTTGVGGALSGVSTIIATSNLDIGGTTAGALAMSAPNVIDSSSFSLGNGSTVSSVTGDYSQSGALNLHAIATNVDHLGISGNANLGGILSVAFSPPPAPGNGLLAVVLSAGGSITGTFSTLNVTGLLPTQTAKLIYNAHTVQISVEQVQAITNFTATPPNPNYSPGGTFTVSATGGGSLYPVVFSIAPASSAICSAGGTNGATITMLSVGTCTVFANQADDGTFAAAPQVSLDVAIAQATQALTITAPTTSYVNLGPATLTATASSGLPVTVASTTPTICTVSGTAPTFSITLLAPGTCTLSVAQGGDTNHAPAAQNVSIAVLAPLVPTPMLDRRALLALIALIGLVALARVRRA